MGEQEPKLDVWQRVKHVGRSVSRLVLGPRLFSPISEHQFKHPEIENTGGGPMIDRELYREPTDGEAREEQD